MPALPIDLNDSLYFLLNAIVLTLAPGPDNLMVLSIGLSKGVRQGVVFGIGCALGCLSHTLLVAFGVSALIRNSPMAFRMLCIVGSLYLIWLGIQSFRSKGIRWPSDHNPATTEALWPLFLKGLLANAINPKVILFFLALLPRFFNPAVGNVGVQAIQLGVIFTLQALVLFSLLGFFSGKVGLWLQKYPSTGLWLDRLAALVFIGLGISLQFTENGLFHYWGWI